MKTVPARRFVGMLMREEVPLSVVTFGRARLPEAWSGRRDFSRRGLHNHLLWGVVEGRLQANTVSGAVSIPTGSVMWVHGGNEAWFSMPEECDRVEVYFLRFGLGDGDGFRLKQTLSVTPGVRELGRRFSALIELAGENPTGGIAGLQLRARLADLLADLTAESETAGDGASGKPGLKVHHQRLCLDFIRANIRRFFTLAELADHCRLNPVYLSSRFRATFGRSLQSFIKSARIREAQSLLLETAMSISEIAETLGYRDIYYFSKQFKNETGASPGNWRKGPAPCRGRH